MAGRLSRDGHVSGLIFARLAQPQYGPTERPVAPEDRPYPAAQFEGIDRVGKRLIRAKANGFDFVSDPRACQSQDGCIIFRCPEPADEIEALLRQPRCRADQHQIVRLMPQQRHRFVRIFGTHDDIPIITNL